MYVWMDGSINICQHSHCEHISMLTAFSIAVYMYSPTELHKCPLVLLIFHIFAEKMNVYLKGEF